MQEVQISHCKYITDECVEAILSGGANISSFEIQGCPMLTGEYEPGYNIILKVLLLLN